MFFSENRSRSVSYLDVGKDAKRAGRVRPSVARRLDPVPEKHPPGVAKPHRKAEKPFGFSYEEQHWWVRLTGDRKVWKRRYSWFKSEQAASQALRAFAHKHGAQEWYRDLRAERRDERTGAGT
jgi:hypothetical protein